MAPLKNLLKERINQDHGELVPIEGLPVKLSKEAIGEMFNAMFTSCLLYTSDAADE